MIHRFKKIAHYLSTTVNDKCLCTDYLSRSTRKNYNKKIQAENLASISHKKETRKNITCITVENVVK